MSEYQYYEWQTVDCPLTEDELAEVSQLSSHMDVVTSSQAIITYSWGNFKHDPLKVLQRYFDAMLYLTDWGTRFLAFRFPKWAIDAHLVEMYSVEDAVSLTEAGDVLILEIAVENEEETDWVEGEGLLTQLLPLRAQIIRGDYRALYLASLQAIALAAPESEESELEPPVPDGLRQLNGSLQRFRTLIGLDPYLLSAAAAGSADLQPEPEVPEQALAALSRAECEAYLLRVLRNEPQVGQALRKRLAELAGLAKPAAPSLRRPVEELEAAAKRLKEATRRRKQAEAERQRLRELEDLAQREEAAWQEVEGFIAQKQATPYDRAVALLIRLRDLATEKNRLPDFQERVKDIRFRYGRRPALLERMDKAKL
jgi:hypothetical protein